MQKQVEIKTVTLLCHKTSEDSQGRSLLCYSVSMQFTMPDDLKNTEKMRIFKPA
jgi:hypothetical protein